MNLRTPIRLQCYFFEPDQMILDDLGVEINRYENTREVVVYSVDNISPYFKEDGWYAAVASGGTDYLTTITMQQAEQLIERSR